MRKWFAENWQEVVGATIALSMLVGFAYVLVRMMDPELEPLTQCVEVHVPSDDHPVYFTGMVDVVDGVLVVFQGDHARFMCDNCHAAYMPDKYCFGDSYDG